MPDKALQELCRVVAALRHPREAEDFLRALLTPAERARIALRWRLVCLLEAGMKQRAIADKLGISLCKITRGSRELKHGPSCFRNHVRKSIQ
ncbi:MAG: trp operon repressor [Verrucomicrobia bacterium]|nr:trp operon repressor [Verrucomicrobiota bacterium]MCG2678485.1 trp operon repressor [Kiritimatiellia bacterium]MBU4247991.1 trp operon repressor [Verrucomicrobiota bacterium]MBU4289578.1 trp operon repressor [Verrucomicrobiota bacterium]MBU4427730.1 trp operon repressor [Verrucomicrobiota bacterium]